MGYNQGPPVMYQPGQGPEYGAPLVGAAPVPLVPIGIPPGLEYLAQVSPSELVFVLNYSIKT